MQQCSQPLRSQKSGNRPLDAGLIAVAQKVEEGCGQMLEQGKLNVDSKITVLKQRGEALLLLGKSSGDLSQTADAMNYLTNAKKNFQEAVTLDSNNPQVRFYLGLAKQLRQDGSFKKDYKAAIDLYLRGDSKQTKSVDYPILAKLAAYLPQEPGQTDYSPENFNKADQLYQKAIALTSDRSNQVKLSYNRGVLNYRNNKSVDAAKILSNVSGIDPKNPFPKQYLEKCIINSALNPSLCQPPSESSSVAANASLPFRLPVYSCQQYPSLAIAKLASGTPDELCQ